MARWWVLASQMASKKAEDAVYILCLYQRLLVRALEYLTYGRPAEPISTVELIACVRRTRLTSPVLALY